MDLCTSMFVGTTFTTAKQWGRHAWPWMDKQISKNTHTGVSLAQKRRKVLSRATTQWTQDSMFSDIEASPQKTDTAWVQLHELPRDQEMGGRLQEGGAVRGDGWAAGGRDFFLGGFCLGEWTLEPGLETMWTHLRTQSTPVYILPQVNSFSAQPLRTESEREEEPHSYPTKSPQLLNPSAMAVCPLPGGTKVFLSGASCSGEHI